MSDSNLMLKNFYFMYCIEHANNNVEKLKIIDALINGEKTCNFDTGKYKAVLTFDESKELYDKIFEDFESDKKSNIKSLVVDYINRCVLDGNLTEEYGKKLLSQLLKSIAANKFDINRIRYNSNGEISTIENIVFVNKTFKNISNKIKPK